MYSLLCWIAAIRRVGHYFVYRLGLRSCPPPLDDIYEPGSVVVRHVYRWNRYMRIIGAENLPPNAPVMFAANHSRFDDPIVMFLAISLATKDAYHARFMMRKGAFDSGTLMKSFIFDMDEFATLVAAIQMDRDKISWKQLKPFVKRLSAGKALAMYPGRTRSRSGMIMEWVDFVEPGSPAFLMTQAMRARPELDVPAVTLTRTFNPLTKESTFVFGKPLHIGKDASRDDQRAFDLSLLEAIGSQSEINAAHILAGLIYNHLLHNRGAVVREMGLIDAAVAMKDRLDGHILAPDLRVDPRAAARKAMKRFANKNLLTVHKGLVALASGVVLSCPPLDRGYAKSNPVKYLVNQVQHLPAYCDAVNESSLLD